MGNSDPWPIPEDFVFPNLLHVNLGGDFDPESNFLDRAPHLQWLKLTMDPVSINLALDVLQAKACVLGELTVRPTINDFLTMIELAKATVTSNIEWNCTYSETICEQQLHEVFMKNDKHFIKVSSLGLTVDVFRLLRHNEHLRGVFIGKNLISADELLSVVLQIPNLQWLRIIEQHGPELSEEQEQTIRDVHPGIRTGDGWLSPVRTTLTTSSSGSRALTCHDSGTAGVMGKTYVEYSSVARFYCYPNL